MLAQNSASLSGTVVDPNDAVIPGAEVTLLHLERGEIHQTVTTSSGIYLFDGLPSGDYSLEVKKQGFSTLKMERIHLNVRDRQAIRLELQVGPAAPTVITVTAARMGISADASTGASFDADYSRHLPLNAREPRSLAELAPGVVSRGGRLGSDQINVNGLRSNTNYYMLDGVSADIGLGSGGYAGRTGRGPGGRSGAYGDAAANSSIPVALDATQEVRVQTTSFAPEFGRSAGAQVVIQSRSGANVFHGSAYAYIRNDAVNANDWFANSAGLDRGKMRHADFGGTLGGPIIRNRTFFFASYEGLRLRQPNTVFADVPALDVRESAAPELKPYLNAFPIPNGPLLPGGAARFSAVYSNPETTNLGSLRIDHRFSDHFSTFLRYTYAPSHGDTRGNRILSSNVVTTRKDRLRAFTGSLIWTATPFTTNDLRVNYSTSRTTTSSIMDNFGAAVPLTDDIVFPDGVTSATGQFSLSVTGAGGYSYSGYSNTLQQQVNIVDNLTSIKGKHTLKFGLDYRRLAPTYYNKAYSILNTFNGITGFDGALTSGTATASVVNSHEPVVYPLYSNYSFYGQDTWKATERTTLTYGIRWDINPAPDVRRGPPPIALVGTSPPYGLTRINPLYETAKGNIAPRFGLAYQMDTTPGKEMMFRFGLGYFYDMGYGSTVRTFNGAPYVNQRLLIQQPFPLSAEQLDPPGLPATRPYGQISSADPWLESPRVSEFNIALERMFGPYQSVTVGFLGTRGRKLLRVEGAGHYSNDYVLLQLASNAAKSEYNALQVAFQRRLSHSLQTQISYTYSHSIDNASTDAGGNGFASRFGDEKGSSDFDVRHNLSFSGSFLVPAPKLGAFGKIFEDWWLEWLMTARTGLPFDIRTISVSPDEEDETKPRLLARVRPDYMGLPVWLDDSNAPGGRRLNPDAFQPPIRQFKQGTLGRNAITGFRALQVDFSVRREIPIGERVRLQIAGQAFNILNHPNFANPSPGQGAELSSPSFGYSTGMLNQSLGGGSVYRMGGPRTLQLSLRVQF